MVVLIKEILRVMNSDRLSEESLEMLRNFVLVVW